MTEQRRVIPNVSVQLNRHYGPDNNGSVTRTFYNYTGHTLFITDITGFSRALLVLTPPSKELAGKLLVSDRYSMRESAFQSMHDVGIKRDNAIKGDYGLDPVTTFCDTPVNQNVFGVRVVEYTVDVGQLDMEVPTILENLGLSVQLNGREVEPHPDNSFVLTATATDGDELEEPESKVSFYLKVKLIDPTQKIGNVFINARGRAEMIRPSYKDEGRVPEGMYLTSGCINKQGRIVKSTQYLSLDQVTAEEGFYATQKEALDFGSIDITKRRLDAATLESKHDLSMRDNELKQLEFEQRQIDLQVKEKERQRRDKERITEEFKRLNENIESTLDTGKERFGNTLKFIAETGKNLVAVLVAVGGLLKIISALKQNPTT